MSKTIIHAVAVAAILLSPCLASARTGSAGVGTTAHIGNVGTVRADIKQPRIHSDVKLLKCHKYARGNPYNGNVNYVTVCN